MTEKYLKGRTAMVTGGASGIGRAIALALARAGANLAIGSLPSDGLLPPAAYATQPSDDEMKQVRVEVEAIGVACFVQGFDLRSDGSVQAFYDSAVPALGPIDILVNAAGVCAQQAMSEVDDDTWFAVLDINLNGPYRTIKRCLPRMIERKWGRIINIVSTAANVGHPLFSAYCSSKAALLGLTRCVALEGAPHGVTCNAINPGTVDTGMARLGSELRVEQGGQGATVEENLALIAAESPQQRLIEKEEVAALAVFMCREEARGLTMEDVTLAGGTLW